MIQIGRAWKLWAYRYDGACVGRDTGAVTFRHVGARRWVEIHQLPQKIVPVLVEEILDDPYAPEVTHYGWEYAEDSRHRRDSPTMIQLRAGSDPTNPRRAMMLLDMCFAYGLAAAVKAGEGAAVALRITERPEEPGKDA